MFVLVSLLTCLMVTVMLTDITRFIIPNWAVLAVLALWLVSVGFGFTPQPFLSFGIALLCFAVGFLLYVVKAFGGGDVKLLAVAALFAGPAAILPFVFGVGLFGGALALFLVLVRILIAGLSVSLSKPLDPPRVLTVGEPAPYGVAIALAFLILLWTNQLPGLVLPAAMRLPAW